MGIKIHLFWKMTKTPSGNLRLQIIERVRGFLHDRDAQLFAHGDDVLVSDLCGKEGGKAHMGKGLVVCMTPPFPQGKNSKFGALKVIFVQRPKTTHCPDLLL